MKTSPRRTQEGEKEKRRKDPGRRRRAPRRVHEALERQDEEDTCRNGGTHREAPPNTAPKAKTTRPAKKQQADQQELQCTKDETQESQPKAQSMNRPPIENPAEGPRTEPGITSKATAPAESDEPVGGQRPRLPQDEPEEERRPRSPEEGKEEEEEGPTPLGGRGSSGHPASRG